MAGPSSSMGGALLTDYGSTGGTSLAVPAAGMSFAMPALGIGMGLAGSLLGHHDAKKQAEERKRAIAAAMAEEARIANEEALRHYKAGGIQQGELLSHLQRLSNPSESQGVADERAANIAALAGPETAVGGSGPGAEVAQRAAAGVRSRSALTNQMDLAQALLGAQTRQRGTSARSADVAASRAVIPLQEALFALAQQRQQNQMRLQQTLGNVGPGWAGVAGSALSGLSSAPMMFA
jgi:hypothetical protein